MKKAILFLLVIIAYVNVLAQNVGIGTTTPVSKLHVKGTGSGTQIVLEENAGSILRISNEPSGTGPYIGTTTNNPLSLVTNNSAKLSISTSGNIGIGQPSPTSPLHFSNTLGNKIALWGTNPNHYGIGIQAFQMQFYTPANTDDFVFGNGNSSSLIETMRIKGNGNVGIGTNNPQTTLDINGDVNIENKLLLNNSAGNDGQVLVSNGNAVAPQWKDVAYSNNDRFYYTVKLNQFVSAGIFNDTIQYDTYYANSSAISYSPTGIFTVNKTGLYNINASFLPIAYCSTASESPLTIIGFYIKYPSASLSPQVLYYGKIDYISPISGSSFFGSTYAKEWKTHMVAGTQFYFPGSVFSSFITTSSGFGQGTELSINLISE